MWLFTQQIKVTLILMYSNNIQVFSVNNVLWAKDIHLECIALLNCFCRSLTRITILLPLALLNAVIMD